MNKQVVISIMAALAIGVIAVGFLYMQKGSELKDAESEISGLQTNVSSLQGTVSTIEGEVSSLEGNVSTLEGELGTSQATVATLATDLAAAKAQVSTLEADLAVAEVLVSELSDELTTIRNPRHFSSLQELTGWLAQDNTDTAYPGKSTAELALILQVRALRDGYLLPAFVVDDEGFSLAVIGYDIYGVNPDDDDTEWGWNIEPLPSYPLEE